MSNDFENELFNDLDIAEEKSFKPKEAIIDKVYQFHNLSINEMRGEYIINPILDDKNKTVAKYNTSTLIVYDDENLKHFKDKASFDSTDDEFVRSKYIYQYKEYKEYIKDKKVNSIRFVLPSKDSYAKSLLNEDKNFINEEYNVLHNKLASNMRSLWNECDVLSQYFQNVIQSYFYGKIYKYVNLSGEEMITNSKIVLFELKGKAFPIEWTFKFNELKKEFADVDTNQFDKAAFIDYMKELFSKKIDMPKTKLFKLFFSKVSENPKSTKNMKNDNDCIITHLNPKQLTLDSRIIKEDDFYYNAREKQGSEWVDKKERLNLDLSQIVTLDSIYDEETKRYNQIKLDNTKFDVDWYKMKIAESDRLIKTYKLNPSNTNINDII